MNSSQRTKDVKCFQYTNAAWAEREGIGKEIRWTEVDDHKLG